MIWIVKDHYKGKVYLRTDNQSLAVKYANYYNEHKKVPFTQFKISFGPNIFNSLYDVDINKQFGERAFIKLYPDKFNSPFVKDNKRYSLGHMKYLKDKYELIKRLCYKYHLWPYSARDGHKLCGFDW